MEQSNKVFCSMTMNKNDVFCSILMKRFMLKSRGEFVSIIKSQKYMLFYKEHKLIFMPV